MACPCGGPEQFESCCGRYIDGAAHPPTAEALMRSRFSAFAKQRADYLLATWHPSRRGAESHASLEAGFSATRWHRLQILSSLQQRADEAEVEYVAFYSDSGGRPGQLHERSRFTKQGDRWWYLDGRILAPIKLGRNEVCWCGSDRKLKHCHRE